jgi:flavin-binding protein dodecin
MTEHIYKQIELTGSSKTSVEDAVQNAITKASKTRNSRVHREQQGRLLAGNDQARLSAGRLDFPE